MSPDSEFEVAVLESVLGSDEDSTKSLVTLVADAALALSFTCEPESLPVFLAWADAMHPGSGLTETRIKVAKIEMKALNAYLKAIMDAIS